MLTPQQERELICYLATPVLALYAPVWSRSASQADVEKLIDNPPAPPTSTAGPFASGAGYEQEWVGLIMQTAPLVVVCLREWAGEWAAGKLLDAGWQQVCDWWRKLSPQEAERRCHTVELKVTAVATGFSEDAITEVVNELLKRLTK